jgi:hypothetical protein
VLDHPHGDIRDVEHLALGDRGGPPTRRQVRAAACTGARLVEYHLIGLGDLPQGAALVPGLTAGLAPRPAAQRLRRRLVQPVGRRRLRRVPRRGGQLPLQLRDLRILLGDPRLQLRDHPLLRGHERYQLLVGRSGHGPILHIPAIVTRLRHANDHLDSHAHAAHSR